MKKEAKESKSIVKAKKKLGKELFELCKDRFTQRELAKKVDTPNTTLKYIEDGINVNIVTEKSVLRLNVFNNTKAIAISPKASFTYAEDAKSIKTCYLSV